MKNQLKNKFVAFSSLLFMVTVSVTVFAQPCQPYLGQTPPDEIALRFGDSNYLSTEQWWWHGSPAFSPDGNEMYFSKYLTPSSFEIWFTKYENNQWTIPARASFSNAGAFDNNPVFRGNDTLYFFSSRLNYYKFIFRVTRSNNGAWSAPVGILLQVPSQYYCGSQFAISRNGNIYAELDAPPYNNTDLYFYKLNTNGQYNAPQKLNSLCTDSLEFTPYIDPAERFIVFSSRRVGGFSHTDLYISYKNEDETWREPQNMGEEINGTFASFPNVTPDGDYLFFNTKRGDDISLNAYWINTSVFEHLNPFSGVDEISFNKSTEIELFQNSPNPCNSQTTISFELKKSLKISIQIYDILGKKVKDFIENKKYPEGKNEILFNVSSLQSGTYNCVLTSENGEKLSNKIIVVR